MANPTREEQISKLRKVVKLVNEASEVIISEWENDSANAEPVDGIQLPSRAFFNAQKTLLASSGSIEELVADPSLRLISCSMQYWESRALQIAAEHRIADMLDKFPQGKYVGAIAREIGMEPKKLSRVLRLLTSQHIFRETGEDIFANNVISQRLVGNEGVRAYIMLFALDLYSASDFLPVALTDPVFGPSYKVEETAFQMAVGTTKPRWDWLAEKVPESEIRRVNSRGYPRTNGNFNPPTNILLNGNSTNGVNGHDEHTNGYDELPDFTGEKKLTNGVSKTNGLPKSNGHLDLVARPELETFALAMVGGGKMSGTAHIFDYPWQELGKATVVDVGGGAGGFPLQLSYSYPDLSFVIQDSLGMLEQGKTLWQESNPEALSTGRAQFVEHDFFKENPTKDADVYWLRYIMHDWSDEYCIDILSKVRSSMGSNSRILICDQVMNTTLGCKQLDSAPEPLLANYGNYVRYSHQRDLTMMSIINGIERTPAQFNNIIEKAGLKMEKIWECRSQVGIVECRLASE